MKMRMTVIAAEKSGTVTMQLKMQETRCILGGKVISRIWVITRLILLQHIHVDKSHI